MMGFLVVVFKDNHRIHDESIQTKIKEEEEKKSSQKL
jgi:hypothetical protein